MKLVPVAYIISAAIGYAVGHYLLEGAPAAYASILISYHLFLVYLVVTAEHEKGLSFPIGQALATHCAFLALLIALPYMRAHIPFFGLITWAIPGLAPFETKWLFSGKGKTMTTQEETPAPPPMAEADAGDHEAFRDYLRQPDRTFRKPGISVSEEFNLWLTDRAKKRAAAAAAVAQMQDGSAVSAVGVVAPPD